MPIEEYIMNALKSVVAKTITFNGKVYNVPVEVISNNNDDCYHDMYLDQVITGQEDFDRIDNKGGDWLNDTELFWIYAEANNMDEDDVNINDVRNGVFAYYTYNDGEDYAVYVLEEYKA